MIVKNKYKKICKIYDVFQIFVYLFINKSYCQQVYSSQIIIPEEVTYMNRTRTVTSIGACAFALCKDLKTEHYNKNRRRSLQWMQIFVYN